MSEIEFTTEDINYLISRIDSAILYIRHGNSHMAIAKLLADKSALTGLLDNPDLPYEFVRDALEANEEIETWRKGD